MAHLKKKLGHLHSTHARNDGESPKQPLSIPPGALGMMVAERKRKYPLRSSPLSRTIPLAVLQPL